MADWLKRRWRLIILAALLLLLGTVHTFISTQSLDQPSMVPSLRMPLEQPHRDTERFVQWLTELVSRIVEILKRLLDREE